MKPGGRTRRRFLTKSMLGIAGAVSSSAARAAGRGPDDPQTPAGMPPAFGTGPAVGPDDHAGHHRRGREARAGPVHRRRAGAGRRQLAGLAWPRSTSGERDRAKSPSIPPWPRPAAGTPSCPGQTAGPDAKPVRAHRRASAASAGPRRGHRLRAAAAPCPAGSSRARSSSERLTQIYLDRLARLGPPLECVITLTPEPRPRSRRGPPTPRSPPAATAGRSTASPGEQRISSTPPASPPPGAPRRTGGASRPGTPRW